MNRMFRLLVVSAVVVFCSTSSIAQRYLTDYDSSLFIRDTVRTVIKRMENLSFSGYIQPQFQVAESKGAASFNGGNFSEFANNRFTLRRARIKLDYRLPSKNGSLPAAVFTFQIDATERGVITRDMFMRLYEPKYQHFSLVMGFFARPFGYEVNLGSGVRESPERGRMSQILFPGERDLGAMITYDKQTGKKKSFFKWDIGAFNGQGQSSTTEFDSFKDVISRVTFKPQDLSKNITLSGGLSFIYGGWRQENKYRYEIAQNNGNFFFKADSSISNIGDKVIRNYYGADLQLAHKHKWGKTEIRGEYWRGRQPGTVNSTVNPGALPLQPAYLRQFDGAFFYFLQNIVNKKNELILKYDWYDPNTKVASDDIGKANTNLTAADIKFSTFGVGFTHYFNNNLKLLGYYDFVSNEKTQLAGLTNDLKDNTFTLRFQLSF